MANWTDVITNAGNDVLSEWVNEKTLNFDSAAAGQGTVATAGMLAQTALVNQKQIASIIGADRVSTGIRLKIRITAPQTAYTLNQYGVWASVTGGSSTMIALFQHEGGIPIPSATESPDFVYTFYALISTSNTGEWTVNIDTSALVTLDDVATAIATAVATKEGLIKDADAKNSIADADAVAVVDSADSSKTKRVLWSTIKSALRQIFVPLTRKINNKALSADITLTGDDIKTSATDETTVSSSLSNKANGLVGNVQLLGYTKIAGITENGTYLIFGGPSYLSDYPEQLSKDGLNYGLLRVTDGESYKTYEIIAGNAPATKFGFAFGFLLETGIAWERVADTTPPQEYSLPLAEGFSKHYCASYCKTQDGMVTVALWIAGSGAANAETTIATLPEGFRPAELFRAAGVADTGTISSQNQCGITVNEYGQIAVQAKSAWGYVSSIFTFRAAD